MATPIHKCNQEQKIDGMKTSISRLEKAVFEGNGSKSMVVMVAESHSYQKAQYEDLKSLKSDVGVLVKFQAMSEGSNKALTRYRSTIRWIIGILVTLIVGFGSALIIVLV